LLDCEAKWFAATRIWMKATSISLGRVDGFDQDEGAGQSEEGGEVSRRLLTA
jgi:hypothetical protein